MPTSIDGIRPRQRPATLPVAPIVPAIRTTWQFSLRHFRASLAVVLTLGAAGFGLHFGLPNADAYISSGKGAGTSHAGHVFRQPAAISNGLVDWYPLDNSLKDFGSNGADATKYNYSKNDLGWVDGKFGKGLQTGGVGSKYAATTNVQGPQTAATYSVWLKPTGYNPSSVPVGMYNSGSTSYMQLIEYDNSIEARILQTGSTFIGRRTGSVIASTDWIHVAFTWSGGTTDSSIKIFINGVQSDITDSDAGTFTGPGTGATQLVIGAQNLNGGGSNFYNGQLDDLRVYNRALSGSEITKLYQGSQPTSCDQTCVGYWKFDEASGTAAADSSGTGNPGTLTGFSFDGSTNGWSSGVLGNALQFDGNNNRYVTIPDSSSLDVSSAITLSAWVKFTGTSYGYASIISKWSSSNFAAYDLDLTPTGQLRAVIDHSQFGPDGPVLPYNLWTHVVMTFDTHTYTFYINGTKAFTGLNNVAIPNNTNPVTIGRNWSDAWTGMIDDVRIYNRVLPDYEVYEQYAAGK